MIPFINKQNDLIAQLHDMQIKLLEKLAQSAEDKVMDEITKRRNERKFWVQIIVVVKMRARALEAKLDYLYLLKNSYCRHERVHNTGFYKEYIENADIHITHCKEARQRNGDNLLMLSHIMKHHFIKLSREEYQAALSISDVEWERHEKQENIRDLSTLVFVCKLGDEALSNQVLDNMIHLFKTNEKMAKRIRWRTAQFFPALS
jgi:hypothetical protein